MKTVKGSLLKGLLLLPAAAYAVPYDCNFVKTDVRDEKHGAPSIVFSTTGGTQWDLQVGVHHFSSALTSGKANGQILTFEKLGDDHAEQEQQTSISIEKNLFDPSVASGTIEIDLFRTVDSYDRDLKLTRTLGGWEYMDAFQCKAGKNPESAVIPSP